MSHNIFLSATEDIFTHLALTTNYYRVQDLPKKHVISIGRLRIISGVRREAVPKCKQRPDLLLCTCVYLWKHTVSHCRAVQVPVRVVENTYRWSSILK